MVSTNRPQDRSEQFHDDRGTRAELRCYGERYCTLDVWLPVEEAEQESPGADLQVLWQPRDPRSGLPRGVAQHLLQERLRLITIPGQRQAIGRSRLPGVRPDLAPKCHYRISLTENEPQ